jgi:hypothetical protein
MAKSKTSQTTTEKNAKTKNVARNGSKRNNTTSRRNNTTSTSSTASTTASTTGTSKKSTAEVSYTSIDGQFDENNYWSGIIYSTTDHGNANIFKSLTDSNGDPYIDTALRTEQGDLFDSYGNVQWNSEETTQSATLTAEALYNQFSYVSEDQKKNDKEISDFTLSYVGKRGFIGTNNGSTDYGFTFIKDYEDLNIDWNYSNFFNDRDRWMKGIGDITSEPNWMYFKVFFDFNTSNGLFGGILNEKTENIRKISATSALGFYLQWAGHYMAENANARMVSLQKFVKTLNYVSNYAPWFFQAIEGLDSLAIDLQTPLKDRSFKIKCAPDAIDMRLTTLFDFYKFACFDYVNFKEMLPANLRKFNMSIMFFSVPIRFIDTHSKIGSTEYKIRGTRGDNGTSAMCKIINFKNCEFDVEKMFNTPTSMKNETPFEFSTNTIAIKYQRSFETIVNPYFNIKQSMFGIESIQSDIPKRFRSIGGVTNLLQNSTGNKSNGFINTMKSVLGVGFNISNLSNTISSAVSQSLIDETESFCQNLYSTVQGKWGSTPELGNIYDTEDNKISEYDSLPNATYSVDTKSLKSKTDVGKFFEGVGKGIANAFKNVWKKGTNSQSGVGWTSPNVIPKHVSTMVTNTMNGLSENDFQKQSAINKEISGNRIYYPQNGKNSKDDGNSTGSKEEIYQFKNNNAWWNKSHEELPDVVDEHLNSVSSGTTISGWTHLGKQVYYPDTKGRTRKETDYQWSNSYLWFAESGGKSNDMPEILKTVQKTNHDGENITGITKEGDSTWRNGSTVRPNESLDESVTVKTVSGHKWTTTSTRSIRNNKLIHENTIAVKEGVNGPICGNNNCSQTNDASTLWWLQQQARDLHDGSEIDWATPDYGTYKVGSTKPIFGNLEEYKPESSSPSNKTAQDIADGQIKQPFENIKDNSIPTFTPEVPSVAPSLPEISDNVTFTENENVVDQVLENSKDISKGQFTPVTGQTDENLKESALEITQGNFSFNSGYNPGLDTAKENSKEISKGTINSGESKQTVSNNLKDSIKDAIKVISNGKYNNNQQLIDVVQTAKENASEIASGQIKPDINPVEESTKENSEVIATGNFIPSENTVVETAKENSTQIATGQIKPGQTLTVAKDSDQISENNSKISAGTATNAAGRDDHPNKLNNEGVSINQRFSKP